MSEGSKLSEELNIYIPQLSFEKIYEYIVEPKNAEYGAFVIIAENAPQNIQDEYVKYIKYISKYLPSSNIVEIKNKQIIGVAEGVSKGEQSQGKIVMKLIDKGYINNTINL